MKILKTIGNWLLRPVAYVMACFLGLVIMLFSGEFTRNSLELGEDYE